MRGAFFGAEALRQTRRGIPQDGMGSGNYALFRCDIDDSQLLFGAAARKRNLLAQQKQLEELQIQRHALQQLCDRMQQLNAELQRIRPLDYVARASDLLKAQQQLREVEQLLASLDLSEYQDLEQELQRVQLRYHELDARRESLGTELGGLKTNLNNITVQVTRLADQGDALLNNRDRAESYLLDAAALHPLHQARSYLPRYVCRVGLRFHHAPPPFIALDTGCESRHK